MVLAPLADLFDLTHRFPLAFAHAVRRRSELIQKGHSAKTPYAFPQMNSGVMLYRNDATMTAFFAEWKRRYDAAGEARDQITLKDLLWESDLQFYILPPEFNLRRVTVQSHRLLQQLRGQGERVTELQRLRLLEREALEEEWAKDDSRASWHPL